MKPNKHQLNTARFATLYPNGVVVIQHEKDDKDAGRVEWATAWETTLYTNNALHLGKHILQILFSAELLGFRYIPNNASEASKERNLNVGTVQIEYRRYTVDYTLLPNVLHTDLRPCDNFRTIEIDDLKRDPRYGHLLVNNL